tara:strand:+ start:889 stop:1611 length:723 start_codon:yes stop_codon:yes gene_type:complete
MSDSEKLQGQVAELDSSVSSLLESHRKGTKTAGIIAVVAPLFVLLYFSWIYSKVKEFTKPQTIVDMGMAQVELQIPKVVELGEGYVKGVAPELADQGLGMLVNAIPAIRTQIEHEMLEFFEDQLQQTTKPLIVSLEREITENKPELDDAIRETTNESDYKIFKNKVKILVKKGIIDDFLKNELGSMRRLLDETHKKLVTLGNKDKKQLSDEEKLERKLIVLVKQLLMNRNLESSIDILKP